MAYGSSTELTGYRLNKIDRFEKYMGVIWGDHTGCIVFHVKYKDGSGGYVHGGSFISGKYLSDAELQEARDKVNDAKDLLIGEDEWRYLEGKYQVNKDRTLVLRDS